MENTQEDYNVSSLVVLCAPENIENLWKKIDAIENAQCHYQDASGKIIVTLESQNIDEEIKLLKKIESLDGVISAQMIYAYHSKELQDLQNDIQKQDSVPSVLKDEQSSAQEISYGGDAQNLLDQVLKDS
ncbi:nitrate reductase [Helicobacter sp. MIT 11-5569]|uniref:chaperone NapD n=1 Tax=Helicobacter sp. MIT 11-5569 TaxID=1548151 RepID=UPI00051FB777|nr:chaperone NapD [Helicobacter sp. MIT 11-5569]TLD83986.1 nitrate reductase [Helicobacter sp. MIT 11-5569]